MEAEGFLPKKDCAISDWAFICISSLALRSSSPVFRTSIKSLGGGGGKEDDDDAGEEVIVEDKVIVSSGISRI